MHSLDTVEYYLQASEVDGECYQLLAYVSGEQTGHMIAKRSTFKRIEAIHDYIMARGFVTIAVMENGQRVLRTFPRLDRLEIVFPA